MASYNESRNYKIKFVDSPPSEVQTECPICLCVLFRPRMATCQCSHSYCATCINRVERDGKPCPICGQPFTLVDDKRLERILNGYVIYCPHKEKGCGWTGELRLLEQHLHYDRPEILLEGCQFQEILCGGCNSYQCERRLMTDHILNHCKNRDIECEYHHVGCKVKQPQEQMKVHLKQAVSDHLSKVMRNMQTSLSQRDDEIAQLKRELATQKREFHQQHTEHLQSLSNRETEIGELKAELKQQREHSATQLSEIQQKHTKLLQNSERKLMITILILIATCVAFNAYLLHQSHTSDLKLNKLEVTVTKKHQESACRIATEKTRKELEDVKTQLDDINCMVPWICNGSNSSSAEKDFQKMKYEVLYATQQADSPILPVSLNLTQFNERKNSEKSWLSVPFYTHKEGYKMRLVVYPNGKRSGAGTHISVAIYLMSGKYDAKLEWPPNITLEIALINQFSKDIRNITRIYSSVHDDNISERVWDDTMAKHGLLYPQFVSHNRIFKRTDLCSYSEHNSLHFQVTKVEYTHEENSGWFWQI